MSGEKRTNAYVWGYNNTGELGLGHSGRVFTPSPASLPGGIVDLQGGANFSVALTSSGKVLTWGSNQHGQLGDGSRRPRRVPQHVALPHGAKATGIAAGTDHVVVVTTHGDLVTWGRNHRGQLGLGHRDDQFSPVAVRSEPLRSVAAGDGVSAAISAGGRLLTWGRNGSGQLAQKGSTPAGHDVLRPTRSRQIDDRVLAVDAGLRHLVVLTADHRVLTFGTDGAGRPLPRRVELRSGWGRVRSIAAGEDHSLALTDRGLVLSWGANDLGQLGVDEQSHAHPVVRVELPGARGTVISIRAGHRHSLALTDHHEVYAWGSGRFGAVGAGEPKPDATSIPTAQRISLPGAKPTRLGGGGYTSAVFVAHGPAIRLELDPPTATAVAGNPARYRIRAVDAFGTDLGPAPAQVSVTVPGGTAAHTTNHSTLASGPQPGSYSVVAQAGHLHGRAALTVTKGQNR